MRLAKGLGVFFGLLLLTMSGCASTSKKNTGLEEMQYDYSAAIRWGNFEGAWTVVDPKYRKEHPMTDLEFARYDQIQVSGYRDLASTMAPDKLKAMREIRIGVINKHTMTERNIRYTELWRYEPETKTWWLVNGLPDFWAGE